MKYNDGFIANLSEEFKDLKAKSFEELHDYFVIRSSNIFSSLIHHLKQNGHEAELIIVNFKELQTKWCEENNIPMTGNWQFDIAKQRIVKGKPDVLFLHSNFEYYGDFLSDIKGYVNKICAWISCPFTEEMDLRHLDHIFTLFEPHYDYFIEQHKSTTLVHATFDETVIERVSPKKNHEISFVGGIGGYHKLREKQLKSLIKAETGIQLWGYGFQSQVPVKNFLKQLKNGFIFNRHYKGEVWGLEMMSILAQSKITFNSHGDIQIGHAVNLRLFEATGAGALLITEYAPGIENFFIPGEEIICYHSMEEAIALIKYYKEHDDERLKIARAGQKRTLNDYTMKEMYPTYERVLLNLLDGSNNLGLRSKAEALSRNSISKLLKHQKALN